MDGITQLADLGALGAILAFSLSFIGYLIRDLIKQRDQSQASLVKLSDSLDKLSEAHSYTRELIKTTTQTLLQEIRRKD